MIYKHGSMVIKCSYAKPEMNNVHIIGCYSIPHKIAYLNNAAEKKVNKNKCHLSLMQHAGIKWELKFIYDRTKIK